jgi:hypothetical protein
LAHAAGPASVYGQLFSPPSDVCALCEARGAEMKPEQASLLCLTCDLLFCDQQALGCQFRLFTKPNYNQKRKAANDKKREAKRATETGRTKYWRERARRLREQGLI